MSDLSRFHVLQQLLKDGKYFKLVCGAGNENAEEVFKKLEEQGVDPVIFGLSDNDFQLLAKNFAHIRAHMMKQNVMIDEYKNYYEEDIINNNKKEEK